VSECVLDASAVIALMRGEPGHESVAECLVGLPAKISAVNLTEVVAKLAQEGWREDAIRGDALLEALDTVDFDKDLCFTAGLLRPLTMRAGLSLADRACLALAQRLGLPAVTADRSWTALQLPITVQCIR
jgi:ribonuclease VapC